MSDEEIGISSWMNHRSNSGSMNSPRQPRTASSFTPIRSQRRKRRSGDDRPRLSVAFASLATWAQKRCLFPMARRWRSIMVLIASASLRQFDRASVFAATSSLDAIEEKAPGQLLMRHTVTVEIEETKSRR